MEDFGPHEQFQVPSVGAIQRQLAARRAEEEAECRARDAAIEEGAFRYGLIRDGYQRSNGELRSRLVSELTSDISRILKTLSYGGVVCDAVVERPVIDGRLKRFTKVEGYGLDERQVPFSSGRHTQMRSMNVLGVDGRLYCGRVAREPLLDSLETRDPEQSRIHLLDEAKTVRTMLADFLLRKNIVLR